MAAQKSPPFLGGNVSQIPLPLKPWDSLAFSHIRSFEPLGPERAGVLLSKDAGDGSKRNILRELNILKETYCKYDDHGRSLMPGLKTRWKGAQLGQFAKAPLDSREQTVVSLCKEDAHHPTGLCKGCTLQKGKVLHFLLWSSQGPVSWVWERSGLVQCSSVCHEPATPSCSWPPDTNQYISRVRAGGGTGKRVCTLLGYDRTKFLFSGLM